jgi:nicotinate phosphoribosyltransferase
MAHSWVMAFENEAEAFAKFAELYPDKTTVLIDTYDTLHSGIQNAITVGRKLMAEGRPFAVRLDSGDIQYLSMQVRRALDRAGLTEAKIAASNELNEDIIHQLVTDGAPIDLWGVGTHLVTGGTESSFSGVYKLAAREEDGAFQPTMKFSDNPEKSTNPGIKQVYRFHDETGSPLADLVAFTDEAVDEAHEYTFHHPFVDYRQFRLKSPGEVVPLLVPWMQNGEIVRELPTLQEIQTLTRSNLEALDGTFKRIINPHIYKVSISDAVKRTKEGILKRYLGSMT